MACGLAFKRRIAVLAWTHSRFEPRAPAFHPVPEPSRLLPTVSLQFEKQVQTFRALKQRGPTIPLATEHVRIKWHLA